MIFVVDTNILFSFFRDNPVRAIIINSPFFGLRLVTPEYAIDELEKIKQKLVKYAKIEEKELEVLFSSLRQCLEVVPMDFFRDCKEKGLAHSPDSKDAPFFALALKIDGKIWSNEPRLKKQNSKRNRPPLVKDRWNARFARGGSFWVPEFSSVTGERVKLHTNGQRPAENSVHFIKVYSTPDLIQWLESERTI